MVINMNKEVDFTSGNLFKKMNMYAIPLILSGLLQLLFSAADLIVCGNFGSKDSVGAIGSTTALTSLIINLFIGISVGSNVLMSRAFGLKDKEKGQRVVYTSMVYSVIIGLIVSAFGFIFSKQLLNLQKTPEGLIDLSNQYLKMYFVGVFFMMIYNFGASILRAVGDTKRPFYFLTIAGFINVIFNFIFVCGFKLDTLGVGIATALSQAVSATLVVIALFRYKGFFHFKLREMRPYKNEGKQIIWIGIPAGLQSVIFSISNVIIQSSINSLGLDVVNGSGAAQSVEGFIYTAMEQTCFACIAFMSANYAIHNYKNIKKILFNSFLMILIYDFIFSGLTLLFSRQLISIYVNDEAAILEGQKRIIILAATYAICGITDVMASAIRGINSQIIPTISTLFGICGTRLIFIYGFFPKEQFHSLAAITWSYPVSWIITLTMHTICFIVMYRNIVKKWSKPSIPFPIENTHILLENDEQ